ncbi:MAG: CCA tRNA nucleotidyltransferase [Candidatus Aenigmarchaeota archaeon]|nr:CCA tRNA nucleotidyltransferase [Candidatus Aenigmarchaeota archaeon]
MEVVLSKVLKRIEPSLHEVHEAHKLFTKVKDIIQKKWPELDVKLMGSVAKDTFLSGDKDLDIFVLFDPKVERKELEKKGLLAGKTVFDELGGKFEVSYAEHPYTRGLIGIYDIEIVPAYKIKNTKNLISAVDRTPFHTKYVRENLKAPGDVRLLKKFLKGIGCYGSDLKTEGYSGYLCELLILKYSTFLDTLKEMQGLKFQEIIDIDNHYTKKKYADVRKRFESQPLIFIDPTDKTRNVAAVLSKEKLAVSINAAALFMEKPTTTFFFPKKKTIDRKKALEHAKKRGARIVVLKFNKPKVIEDILYPQLRRFLNLVAGKLSKEGYGLLRASVFADAACGIALEVDEVTLPETRKKMGPSIFNPLKHRMRFLENSKDVWVEDDRLVSEEKRKHLKIEDFLFDLLKKPLSKLTYEGVPSHIAKEVYRGFDILLDSKVRTVNSDEFWLWVERKAF